LSIIFLENFVIAYGIRLGCIVGGKAPFSPPFEELRCPVY
jgi:hypothetical protein